MTHRISWCLVVWLVSAFLVSVCIRDDMGMKCVAVAVAFFSILATWWGFVQTQYPLRQIILHRFVFAAVFVGLVWYNLPLKVVFNACRPAFERAAGQLLQSGEVKTPFWIGPFRIEYAESFSSAAFFGSASAEGGFEGFVRHLEESPFSPTYCINLDQDWVYISGD